MITNIERKGIVDLCQKTNSIYLADCCRATMAAIRNNGLGNVVAYLKAFRGQKEIISFLLEIIEVDEVDEYTMRTTLSILEKLNFAKQILEGSVGSTPQNFLFKTA